MNIRFIPQLTEFGQQQWLGGQVHDLPDELAQHLIDTEKAVKATEAEVAVLTRNAEAAVMPRPKSKPKPPAKGRR